MFGRCHLPVYTSNCFLCLQRRSQMTSQNGRLSRRAFFQQGASAFAGAAVLAAGKSAAVETPEAATPDSIPRPGKIALEEHFVIPETLNASYGAAGSPEFRLQLEDIAARRIAEMDRGGIDLSILSLVGPGIQVIPAIPQAIEIARRANDHLAEHVAKYPKRFKGFAALPMQDPQAAARELTRCVRELNFCGALVNG